MNADDMTNAELQQATVDLFAAMLAHCREQGRALGVILVTAAGHHRSFAANMPPAVAAGMLAEILASGALPDADVEPRDMRPVN